MFNVIVTETRESANGAEPVAIERFRQCVDELDIPRLIAAINAKPRKQRERKVVPVRKGAQVPA